MDAGASASARPAGLPVHDARPVGCAHPASRARPAGAGHPLGLRDYMERPADVGHDTVDGETAGDGIVVVRDLDAQGDLRWKDVVADFLVHVSGGIVRWNAQDQASVVLCGHRSQYRLIFNPRPSRLCLGMTAIPWIMQRLRSKACAALSAPNDTRAWAS